MQVTIDTEVLRKALKLRGATLYGGGGGPGNGDVGQQQDFSLLRATTAGLPLQVVAAAAAASAAAGDTSSLAPCPPPRHQQPISAGGANTIYATGEENRGPFESQ